MSAGDPHDGLAPDDESGTEPFSVQVDGHRSDPTRVFVLSRSHGDLVEVREFRAGCSPVEYTSTTDELLGLFERAYRERRRVSESLYAIRLWLDSGH